MAEQLEFVPGSHRVPSRAHDLACACPDVILQVPPGSRPMEHGIPGLGLLSHVLVAKFADHLPL